MTEFASGSQQTDRNSPFMTRIRWFAVLAALLVAGVGYLSFTRTATILVDGAAISLNSRAITVGAALDSAGIELHSRDKVEPSIYAPLWDGLVINVERATLVQLRVDGETFASITPERNPNELLGFWDIEFEGNDSLYLSGSPVDMTRELPFAPFIPLQVKRAVSVVVTEGGHTTEFQSSALTLGEALADHGIELNSADRLSPPPETLLDQPVDATLIRAKPIRIEMGDTSIEVISAATSVGEALAEAGIAIQLLDSVQPTEVEPIPADRVIRIARTSETVTLEQRVLPHETEWQEDPETELGETSVIQLGRDGVVGSRIRVRYQNGEEVSREEEGDRVLVEPRDQLNGYGTQIVIRTAVVDGVEIEYWATMDMYATSYSPCRSGVPECLYGTSTSGVSVARGVVATYKDWLLAARGVSIYVPGYGSAAFYDVGGGFPDGRAWIDLGYTDEDWVGWSSWVTVYFTTPVPQTIPYFVYQ